MSHPFHYFIPGVNPDQWCPGNKLVAAKLREHFLSHLEHLTKPGKVAVAVAAIDGTNGVMFTPNMPDGQFARQVGFDAAGQAWLKPSGKVWIGWEKSEPPGPNELARPNPIRGYTVADDAGNQWNVPIARSPRNMATLPSDLVWDVETGEPTSRRKPALDWLWELSGEVFDYINNPVKTADPAWLQKSALKILQVNYAVSALELNAFQAMGRCVIDELRATLIGLALIDNEIVDQVTSDDAKKNDLPPD